MAEGKYCCSYLITACLWVAGFLMLYIELQYYVPSLAYDIYDRQVQNLFLDLNTPPIKKVYAVNSD